MRHIDATISQMDIFDYTPNSLPLDLKRLDECWKRFPVYGLLEEMNLERGNGRDDNPNLMMMKTLFAGMLLGLPNTSVMARVLGVSNSLREWVGLRDFRALSMGKESPIPQPNAFTNFMTNLIHHQRDLEAIFNLLRDELAERIEGFGTELAGDGKYFDSYAPNRKEDGCKPSDKRGEHDAEYSKKVITYQSKDGEKKAKTETHFGFRKHTLVDVKTELPFASVLTVASMDEKKAMTELVFPSIPQEYLNELISLISYDRGYDATDFLNYLRSYSILPVIDKRLMKKRGTVIQYRGNVYYDDASNFYYLDNSDLDLQDDQVDEDYMSPVINAITNVSVSLKRMKYEGFDRTKYKKETPEELRGALVYSYHGMKTYVYLSDDPRAFNEIARDSDKFKRIYKHRTAVERYHSRLDSAMMFEQHTIRGLGKMKMLTTLADTVILTCAKTHLDLGQTNYSSIFDFGFMPGWNTQEEPSLV